MISHSKPFIEKDDIEAVTEALRNLQLATGSINLSLETRLKKYLDKKHALLLSSGTSALELSMKLAKKQVSGGEVLLPSLGCASLLHPIINNNLKPVFVDSDPLNGNISFSGIKRNLSKGTVALIIPHLFGICRDISEFKSGDYLLIEDCAQALGGKNPVKKAGAEGDVTVLSFYATKMINGGCGGAILTDRGDYSEFFQKITSYDEQEEYFPSFNYKLSDLNSALILSQFKKLDKIIEKRVEIAEKYDGRIKNPKFQKLNYPLKGSCYFRYVLAFSGNVEKLIKSAEKDEISIRRPIYKPLHQYFGLKGFKEADNLFEKMVSIPIYPSLLNGEIEKITDFLNSI